MRKRIPESIFILPVIFLIWSCAKVNTPTGGKRDRISPVVIESSPENRSVFFNDRRIEITLNEFVVLDNINEKFMVSPPLKKRPEIQVKRKSIIVEFDEELRDSTTYTFYFQDAIKDLNEGNILENYQFVFSTGSVVDSLSVTGNVSSAFTLEAPEKTIVMLYRDLQDTTVKKQLPDYISMVDTKGYFRIENVREGQYRLYALKDGDNSKNYNVTDEEFAFADSSIIITAENNFIPPAVDTSMLISAGKKVAVKPGPVKTDPATLALADTIVKQGEHKLILFAARKKAHYLASSDRLSRYHLLFTLSLPPDSMNIDFSIPEISPVAYFIEPNNEKDTINVWLTDSTLYNQSLITTLVSYPFTDSIGNLDYKLDTIPMRFIEPRPTRGVKVVSSDYSVDFNITKGTLKPGQKITFTSQTPFRLPDTTLIRLYEIVDSTQKKIEYTLIKDSVNSGKYIIEARIQEKKQYFFLADSASFGNIYGESADSAGIKFTVKDAESYSKLTLNIKNYGGPLIIQLLNNAEKLLYEVNYKDNEKVEFPLLDPGLYRIRAIFDLNGDGKWTTGDFDSGRQPEPVSYYPREIDIKTGFEIEQDWDPEQNYKEIKLRLKKK